MRRSSRIISALAMPMLTATMPLSGQGIQGGLNLGELIGGDVGEVDERKGLTAGGSYTMLRFGPLSIGPELYYAQKGASAARLAVESPQFYSQFGLNYIEVPIIAKLGFQIPGAEWLGVYAQGGPAFAWNLNCDIERGEESGASLSDECVFADPANQNAEAVIENAEQGLALGGGISIRAFNVGAITLDGRMVRGLSRISSGAIEPDVRNQAKSLMIGFSFGVPGGGSSQPEIP